MCNGCLLSENLERCSFERTKNRQNGIQLSQIENSDGKSTIEVTANAKRHVKLARKVAILLFMYIVSIFPSVVWGHISSNHQENFKKRQQDVYCICYYFVHQPGKFVC